VHQEQIQPRRKYGHRYILFCNIVVPVFEILRGGGGGAVDLTPFKFIWLAQPIGYCVNQTIEVILVTWDLNVYFAFWQEYMSVHEIEAAIHTDSRHADRLRLVYCSRETVECGFVVFKRIDFLGSRKSFEMLKRVSGDNSNVYELLIRA
jgi:hypothetical protein